MMKKKYLLTFIFVIFLAFVTACGSNNGDESEGAGNENVKKDAIKLVYSDADPPSNFKVQFVEDVLIPEIEEKTNGQVTIETNVGGALLSTTEVLEGVESGIADMAAIATEPYAEEMYSSTIFPLFPKAGENFATVSEIYERAVEEIPLFKEDFEKNNQKLLFSASFLPIVFGANYELDNLEQIKGKDWRAANAAHLKILKNAGANTVSVPYEDVYSSLQTGLIDGVLTNFGAFDSMKFYENADNVLLAPQLWYAAPIYFTMNLDTWNGLPDDVKTGIEEATKIAKEEFGRLYKEEQEKLIESEREKGVTVNIASDEDIEPFVDEGLLEELRNEWVEKLEKNYGDENGDEYIEKLKEIIEDVQDLE